MSRILGQRIIAPLLGPFEVLIWLAAIGQIFKYLDNVACYFAYAGGFATGNYVGMLIENRLAIGLLIVRIITNSNSENLFKHIKAAGYGVTLLDGQGQTGPVKILFTVIKSRELNRIIGLINEITPRLFIRSKTFKSQGKPYCRRYHPIAEIITGKCSGWTEGGSKKPHLATNQSYMLI